MLLFKRTHLLTEFCRRYANRVDVSALGRMTLKDVKARQDEILASFGGAP